MNSIVFLQYNTQLLKTTILYTIKIRWLAVIMSNTIKLFKMSWFKSFSWSLTTPSQWEIIMYLENGREKSKLVVSLPVLFYMKNKRCCLNYHL